MKRIVALFLSVILMLGYGMTAASAQTNTALRIEDEDVEALHIYDKFCQLFVEKMGDPALFEGPYLYFYEELYAHRDADGSVDWVLLNAAGGDLEPWYACAIINHRCFIAHSTYESFYFGMGLYDVKEDRFYDLYKDQSFTNIYKYKEKGIDLYAKYDGLSEAVDRYGKGRLLGDMDGDDELSVVDVTLFQRCIANMSDFPENDRIEGYDDDGMFFHAPTYYSDFNIDGKRDVLDVTCMQRFLAGLAYPIG